MSNLPLEILRPIFDDLGKRKDLLQCQLTCKRWYEASVLCLYETVFLETKKMSRLFVHTISESSQLASYLKVIYAEHLLFAEIDDDEENILANDTYNVDDTYSADNISYAISYDCSDFDRYKLIFEDPYDVYDTPYEIMDGTENLFDVIVRQCPNVLEIKCRRPPEMYWKKLKEAAARGQLLHLSELSPPTDSNIQSYVQTALYFTKSLRTLSIYEEGFFVTPEFFSSRAYIPLRQRISEFTRLKCLNILILDHRWLNDLDTLIEDCPHLENINIDICFAGMDLVAVETDTLVNARPGIRTLKHENAVTANNTDQLKYMMQKFTKLQRLEIGFDLYQKYDNNLSPNVLAQFFDYLMHIAICQVHLAIPISIFISAWNEFINTTEEHREVILTYIGVAGCDTERASIEIEQDFIKVTLHVPTDSNVLPHIGLLLNSGGGILSLTIYDVWNKHQYLNAERTVYDDISSFDFLLNIFQLCPSLNSLTLHNPKDKMLLSGELVYQHTKLESLTITQLDKNKNYELFQHISFCFPNLREMHLQYGTGTKNHHEVLKVNFPYSSLDILVWEYDFSYLHHVDNFVENACILIKLKTKESIRFYAFYYESVLVVTEKEFEELLPNNICAEIDCKSLKEIWTGLYPLLYEF